MQKCPQQGCQWAANEFSDSTTSPARVKSPRHLLITTLLGSLGNSGQQNALPHSVWQAARERLNSLFASKRRPVASFSPERLMRLTVLGCLVFSAKSSKPSGRNVGFDSQWCRPPNPGGNEAATLWRVCSRPETCCSYSRSLSCNWSGRRSQCRGVQWAHSPKD